MEENKDATGAATSSHL